MNMRKSKVKSKAKKGKGKKGKASKDRADEGVVKNALANAQLWENRLQALVHTRDEYRTSTRNLLHENELLQVQVAQTEKDTVEVLSFLKNEDIKKDAQIEQLQITVKDLKNEFRKEKQQLISEYTSQIQELQDSLAEKTNEVKLMQAELKLVKDFRRKRAQIQKELDDIKDHMFVTDKEHKGALEKLEKKFLEEKIRLQEEASTKISDLAERAHIEAVSNLDETTRSIYKENVRLNEALSYHVKAAKELEEVRARLTLENSNLNDEKNLNSLIVEEKVLQAKTLKKQVKELQKKIVGLESALTQLSAKHEQEVDELLRKSICDQNKNEATALRLERTLELKNTEACQIRKLARAVLHQRSELETFFLDSLEYVKGEIQHSRAQYRRDAEHAYTKRMLAAHSQDGPYPKVRTFKNMASSSNCVFADLKMAEDWTKLDSRVDICDLTWEQRERVLRLLFAKMNGQSSARSKFKPLNLPAIEDAQKPRRHQEKFSVGEVGVRPQSDRAFLTEASDGNAGTEALSAELRKSSVLKSGAPCHPAIFPL